MSKIRQQLRSVSWDGYLRGVIFGGCAGIVGGLETSKATPSDTSTLVLAASLAFAATVAAWIQHGAYK